MLTTKYIFPDLAALVSAGRIVSPPRPLTDNYNIETTFNGDDQHYYIWADVNPSGPNAGSFVFSVSEFRRSGPVYSPAQGARIASAPPTPTLLELATALAASSPVNPQRVPITGSQQNLAYGGHVTFATMTMTGHELGDNWFWLSGENTKTWSCPDEGNKNWSYAGNWTPAGAPDETSDVVFNDTSIIDSVVDGTSTVNSINSSN